MGKGELRFRARLGAGTADETMHCPIPILGHLERVLRMALEINTPHVIRLRRKIRRRGRTITWPIFQPAPGTVEDLVRLVGGHT